MEKQDRLSDLPPELIAEILSLLPVKATFRFTSVSKKWLEMIKSPMFTKHYHFKSVSKAVVFLGETFPKPYHVLSFTGDGDAQCPFSGCKNIFEFNLPCKEHLYSSVGGLLLLCTRGMVNNDGHTYKQAKWPRDLFVCNPLTFEYIKLPTPVSSPSVPQIQADTFGFGLSRISGNYKVVRIFHDLPASEAKCQIYTVGSGWSGVVCAGPFMYDARTKGAFLNGNIHWLVTNIKNKSPEVSCFNLDTELFSAFDAPPFHRNIEERLNISVLGDNLSFTDTSHAYDIVIWLMKDSEAVKTWTKTFVITTNIFGLREGLVWPIHIFKNGDILLAVEVHNRLYFFSKEMGSILGFHPQDLVKKPDEDFSYWWHETIAAPYTQSFIPLRTYATVENVISYKPDFRC